MLAALLFLPVTTAHIAMWHPSMYGFQADDINSGHAATPHFNKSFDEWWFHGDLDDPPAEGQFLELPAGGTLHAQVACHKVWTDYGYLGVRDVRLACDNSGDENAGALHSHDPSTVEPEQTKDVRGCGLAIAYNSDVRAIKPEDFAVISVNYHCPWYRDVDFQIPEGLPECPPGGCHCMWGWIHSSGGGGQEMYFNGYRCNVTGKTGTVPIPKPVVARKCPFNKNNCTVGAKQPHYWLQAEGNNNFQDYYDPPFYNGDYGWTNGAQTDLWEIDNGATWITNASDLAPAAPMVGEITGGVYVARETDDLSKGAELPPIPTAAVGNNRVGVEGVGSKSTSTALAHTAEATSALVAARPYIVTAPPDSSRAASSGPSAIPSGGAGSNRPSNSTSGSNGEKKCKRRERAGPLRL